MNHEECPLFYQQTPSTGARVSLSDCFLELFSWVPDLVTDYFLFDGVHTLHAHSVK